MNSVEMPQLGESVAEGTVVRWHKRLGDLVAVDEPLFEVSTDKVSMEIPSLYAGILSAVLVAEGETVPVGTSVAQIGAAVPAEPVHATHAEARDRSRLLSPAVRRLAREHGIDVGSVHGSGRGGRVTRADMLARATSGSSFAANGARVPAPATPPAPAAHARPAAALPHHVAPPSPNAVPMSTMRLRIAENVMAAKQSVADVFSVMDIDMEAVHAVRARAKDAFKARTGMSLTYLPFIARATVDALRAFPAVNSRIEGTSLVPNADVHLGIAVDLDEAGLVVPVVRNAADFTVEGLARAIAAAGSGARAGTLGAHDYTGSTFTITNNGAFGTLMTMPIINAPNVAILSTDAIEERVVAINGMIAIRHRMYLCMSWDHRAFDGSTAAKFLARIKRDLEERDWSSAL